MYHAIIVEQSLKNKDILNNLDIIGTKNDSGWTMYKVAIKDDDVDNLVNTIQSNMEDNQGWYTHLYNEDGTSLVVIYKDKAFYMSSDPKTWDEAVAYGKDLNIPEEQLDFFPNKFSDETH